MRTGKLVALGGLAIVALIVAAALLQRTSSSVHAMPAAARKAVVVELFTSEGCSSCPPADELLGRLRGENFADGLEVIPLGLHVDYWNDLGWTDRFSSAGYSQRQAKYAERFHIEGPYTPQMVVDGSSQFVGSDASRAREAITKAALRPQAAAVAISVVNAGRVTVIATAAPTVSGEVMMAITEDNLKTSVRTGENGGRELHHAAVVHQLRSLGQLINGRLQAQVPLVLDRAWKRDDVRIVVFVQETGNGAIEGAAAIPASSLTGAR